MRGTPLKKFGPYRATQSHRKYAVGPVPGYDCWDLWDTRTDTLVGFSFFKEAVYRAGNLLQGGGPAFSPKEYRDLVVSTTPHWVGSLFEYYQRIFCQGGMGDVWVSGGLLPRVLDPLSEGGRRQEWDRYEKSFGDMVIDGEKLFPSPQSIFDDYMRGVWPVEPVPRRVDLPSHSPNKLVPISNQSPLDQLVQDPTIPVTQEWLAECVAACSVLIEVGVGDKSQLESVRNKLTLR